MSLHPSDHAIPNVRSEVMNLLEKLRGAINNGAHQRMYQLTDQLEVLARSGMEPPLVNPLPGVLLTRSEARILGRLGQAKGAVVSKSQLMDAMYFDLVGDEPTEKIVDVFICKLRRKLKLKGASVRIETVWGNGYTLKAVEA